MKDPRLIPQSVNLSKATLDFLRYVNRYCAANKISVHMYLSDQINDVREPENKDLYSGFFADDDPNDLQVHFSICGEETGLGILVHEFCHCMQYIEKDPCYWGPDKDIKKMNKEYDKFTAWLDRKREYSAAEIEKFILIAQRIELNCEHRVLRLASRFRLPINPLTYAREANAYIYFYRAIQKERAWCNKASPSSIPEILKLMPPIIVTEEEALTPPKGYYELVREHCIEDKDVQISSKGHWFNPLPDIGSGRIC